MVWYWNNGHMQFGILFFSRRQSVEKYVDSEMQPLNVLEKSCQDIVQMFVHNYNQVNRYKQAE